MRNRATKVLLAVVSLAICLSGCAKSGPKVPVVSVSDILGIGSVGMINRYAGIVEAGETVKVNKDANLELAEIAVEAGDAVSKGQVLFSYETESLSIEVERMQLEIEQMNNTITTQKSQISTLEKEQKTADTANKLQYTLQIQQLQLDIKETEFKIASKQKEIDQAKAKLSNANVLSPVAGHIKEVNANGETNPQTGEPLPFISITQEGDFRVRGTVNEMNASSFATDMPVIIRSRTDDSVMWTGTVSAVDWENPVQGNNMMMYGGPQDEMTTSSKYPFYVKLDSFDGLMLGQHVYIEPEQGQMAGQEEGDGFYLPSYYINDLNDPDTDPWVWAVNSKDKLEKRPLVLGNYNMDSDSYEIMEGLSLDDYIAYPDENCRVGAPVRYPGEPDDSEPADTETPEEGFEEGFEEGYEEGMAGEEGFEAVPGVEGDGESDMPAETLPGDTIYGGADVPAGSSVPETDPGVAAVQGTEAVG